MKWVWYILVLNSSFVTMRR